MAKVKVVRKGGFFGKLIALLLGIIIGIVAGLGGLAAIIYYAFGVLTIGEVFGYVENATTMDIPEEEYVGADYLDKSLIDALSEVATVITGIGGGTNTFGDLAKISPYVGDSIGGLADVFTEYGFQMTKDDLFAMSAPSFGEYMQTSFGNLALAPLLTNIGGQTIDPSNTIMCALFYGQKGVHYQIVEVEGAKKIEMLPLAYTLATDGNFYDWSDKKYEKVADEWINEDGSGIIKAETESGTNENGDTIEYTHAYYTVKDDQQTLAYRLAVETPAARTATTYIAYTANNVPKLHVGTTVSSLLSEDLMNTMYSLPLADILGLDATSDRMMLALAYGEDGYKIEVVDGVKNLKVLTDEPKTINDLVDSGSDLVKDMSIATLLDLNADSDRMMLALAYGEDGYEIEVVDGVKTLNVLKPSKKIDALVDGGSSLVTDMSIVTVMDLNPEDAASISAIMKSLAFGTEGADGDYQIIDNKIVMNEGKSYKKIDALKGNTSDLVGDIKLSDVMTINGDSSQILQTLKDTKISELDGKISTLTLGQAIKIDSSSSLIMQNLAGTPINEMSTAIDDLTMSEIMEIKTEGENKSSPILIALKDTTVSGLSAKIDTLKVEEVIEINETSPMILKTMKANGTLVKDLGSAIDNLKIDEVIEINETSPKLLQTMKAKGTPVKNLGTAINEFKLSEIIDNVSENTILRHLENSTLTSLSSDINELTIQQVFCDDVYQKVYFAGTTQVYKSGDKYYTDAACQTQYTGSETILDLFVASETKATSDAGSCQYLYHNPADSKYHYYNVENKKESETTGKPVLTGVWSFLLEKNGVEQPYALTETGHLIDNMTVNIQKATMQELSDNKLFIIDQDTLDKAVVTSFILTKTVEIGGNSYDIDYEVTITNDPVFTADGKTIGDLTVLQLMDYITAILNVIG